MQKYLKHYVNKILVLFNRAAIILYIFVRRFVFLFKRKRNGDQKRVLIIFQQAIGDSVLLSASLGAYLSLFPAENGWKVKMICLPLIDRFMHEVLTLPTGLLIECVDFKRLIVDFRYFRSMARRYSREADITIVPGTSLSAELLSASLHVENRVGLLSAIARKTITLSILQKLAYTRQIRPPENMMVLQSQKYLLHTLGEVTYKAKLPVLLPQERIVDGCYAVVCPGASVVYKTWPKERFLQVIDLLTGEYGLDVHLCGSAAEKPVGEYICANAKMPEKVVAHMGSTEFWEWSSLIQHSVLAVGNDSGAMHLAAAAQVPSVCIAGSHDFGQFFPYCIDMDENEEVRLPETAVVNGLPCAFCWSKYYSYGHGNGKCLRQVRAGKCTACVDAITVDEVIDRIRYLLEQKGRIQS